MYQQSMTAENTRTCILGDNLKPFRASDLKTVNGNGQATHQTRK